MKNSNLLLVLSSLAAAATLCLAQAPDLYGFPNFGQNYENDPALAELRRIEQQNQKALFAAQLAFQHGSGGAGSSLADIPGGGGGGGLGGYEQTQFVRLSDGTGGTVVNRNGITLLFDSQGRPIDKTSPTGMALLAALAGDDSGGSVGSGSGGGGLADIPAAAAVGGRPMGGIRGGSFSSSSGYSITNDNGKVSGVAFGPGGTKTFLGAASAMGGARPPPPQEAPAAPRAAEGAESGGGDAPAASASAPSESAATPPPANGYADTNGGAARDAAAAGSSNSQPRRGGFSSASSGFSFSNDNGKITATSYGPDGMARKYSGAEAEALARKYQPDLLSSAGALSDAVPDEDDKGKKRVYVTSKYTITRTHGKLKGSSVGPKGTQQFSFDVKDAADAPAANAMAKKATKEAPVVKKMKKA